jgi:peptidyl-dipeptidase A
VQYIVTETELKRYLDELEGRLEEIGNRMGELSFQRYVDRKPNPELADLQQQRAAIMLDKRLAELVENWVNRVADPLLQKRLQAWSNSLLGAQVTARDDIMQLTRSIGDRLIAHLYDVQGQRIDLGTVRGIVRSNPDPKLRQAAWESYAELSRELANDMLQLIRLRNTAARAAGFDNYVDMVLHLNGMSTAEVESILQELTTATEDAYQAVLRQGAAKLGLDRVEPWDVQYILEQAGEVPNQYFTRDKILPALHAWASLMNIDLKALGISHHWIDIPYNGLTMSINRRDIRILGNPTDGYAYYKTAFHEVGHALHGALKQVDSLMLRRESSIFTEGMAEVFGYISHHPAWMESMGLSPAEITAAQLGARGPWFFYLRQRTAFCLFEYEVYKNPEQDIDALCAQMEAQILGGGLNAMPRWAANAWYVNYPVYWQNYVLADVVASQVHHHLEKEIGSLYNNPAAFEFVVNHYIAPGALVPWMEKIETATGSRLSAQALIEDMNR